MPKSVVVAVRHSVLYVQYFGFASAPLLSQKHNLKLIIMILENQEIRIEVKDGKYFLSRYENGKVKEQYRPETNEVIQVWIVSVLNGFEPPRNLLHLDKLTY